MASDELNKNEVLVAFKDLFPTANLLPKSREALDNFLPDWFEMLNRYKNISFGYPVILKQLQKAVLNIDIYNGLTDDILNTAPGENQDTPVKEWWHQVRNLFMRTNAIRGVSNIYEFGEYADSLKDLDSFNQLSRETRSDIHLHAINSFLTEITSANETGQLVHQPNEKITWFGKSVPFDEMVVSALVHDVDHSKIFHTEYIRLHGGLPPIQVKLSGAPPQNK